MPASPTVSFSASTHPGAILHWFRRDLRTHDNRALNHAVRRAAALKLPLIPLYLLDSSQLSLPTCGVVRARFILQSLHVLQRQLHRKCGARLRVIQDGGEDALLRLVGRWGVREVVWEREYEWSMKERDIRVQKALEGMGVGVTQFDGFLLHPPEKLIEAAGGRAPENMSGFIRVVDEVGEPAEAVEFADVEKELTCSEEVETGDDKEGLTEVPRLEMFGHSETVDERWELFKGGEVEGLKRLEEFCARDGGRAVARFAKPETSPAAVGKRETTVLSPYLAVGCVSVRVVWKRVREVEREVGRKGGGMVQSSLWGQLLWREHFWGLAFCNASFHRMRGNQVCRVIDWEEGGEGLKAWEEGRTGYPWIDALMVQLKQEGWVHHLGRHSLACFLTRGDLWVSWEKGYEVFERYLVDYDYALNSANWMWLSCSAFFVMYYRVYSPVAFAKKWDKDGKFVKHYLPVLKKLPTKYVHEPWKAPLSVQKAAGCVVGKDYPKRIVDHAVVSKENIERMKAAYARNEFGAEKWQQGGAGAANQSNREGRASNQNSRARKKRKTNS